MALGSVRKWPDVIITRRQGLILYNFPICCYWCRSSTWADREDVWSEHILESGLGCRVQLQLMDRSLLRLPNFSNDFVHWFLWNRSGLPLQRNFALAYFITGPESWVEVVLSLINIYLIMPILSMIYGFQIVASSWLHVDPSRGHFIKNMYRLLRHIILLWRGSWSEPFPLFFRLPTCRCCDLPSVISGWHWSTCSWWEEPGGSLGSWLILKAK